MKQNQKTEGALTSLSAFFSLISLFMTCSLFQNSFIASDNFALLCVLTGLTALHLLFSVLTLPLKRLLSSRRKESAWHIFTILVACLALVLDAIFVQRFSIHLLAVAPFAITLALRLALAILRLFPANKTL